MTDDTTATEPDHPVVIALKALHPDRGWLTRGDQAALRRARPDQCAGSALFRFLAHLRGEGRFMPDHGDERDEAERRWTVILGAACRLAHIKGTSVGHALADAGFADLRLERLLASSGIDFLRDLDRAVRFLDGKSAGCDLFSLYRLVMADDQRAERERRQLARDFFARRHQNAKS
ncbi:MAG: type I-E CRISPR-associated protein Cse2/CasB [Planctomycetota bacterium]